MSPLHGPVAAAGMLLTQMPYGVRQRPAAPGRLARRLPSLPDPLNCLCTRKPGAELGPGKREALATRGAFPSRRLQPPGKAHTSPSLARKSLSLGSLCSSEAAAAPGSPWDPPMRGRFSGCWGSHRRRHPTVAPSSPARATPAKGISFGMRKRARVLVTSIPPDRTAPGTCAVQPEDSNYP